MVQYNKARKEINLGPQIIQLNSIVVTTINFYTKNYQGKALNATLFLP